MKNSMLCRIRHMVLGDVQTNCYIVYCQETGQGVVIDPADEAGRIMEACGELHVEPAAILLTHGHFDHFMAAGALREKYGISVYVHEKDMELAADPSLNASGAFGWNEALRADKTVADGQVLRLAGLEFKVLATPGHTAGGVCYYIENQGILFSGDTLFAQSVGRTDLPTGSYGTLTRSIREKLAVLPDDTKVFPGHGPSTTIGYEKRYNPFLTL